MNQLVSQGSISIDGVEVELEFFLGGDMKFLLMILGLSSATADYACLWCKIHNDFRWDTSKPMNYYNEEPIRRTLEEMKKHCHSKDNFGCIHEPLGSVERQHFYELSILFVFLVFYHYFLAFTVAKRLHYDVYLLPSSFIRNLHYY